MTTNGINPFTSLLGRDFDKFFVGFDEQFTQLAKLHNDLTKNIPNYPPYNIKKTGENTYTIELAVAGFGKQDIEIEIDDGILTIKGSNEIDKDNYIHRGIANRNFTRSFVLNDEVKVQNAHLLNGMLKIILERITPEHNKPKKIDISEEPSTVSEFAAGNKQLLQEEGVPGLSAENGKHGW